MNNPVAWQMWDAEALALAKKFNRLLFVSIGYAACHCTINDPLFVQCYIVVDKRRVSCHGAGIFRVSTGRQSA